MIVLNKKTIRIFVLSIFVFALGIAFASDKKESVPTVTLPVSGKTIVIDAGHGKPDEGAESRSGTTEAETNLKIVLKLQNLLLLTMKLKVSGHQTKKLLVKLLLVQRLQVPVHSVL